MKKKKKVKEYSYDKITKLRWEEAREAYYWMNIFPGSTREELASLFSLGDEHLFNREMAWLKSEDAYRVEGGNYYLNKD